LERNGSFGFLSVGFVCWQKPNVPFVRWVFSVWNTTCLCQTCRLYLIADSSLLESMSFYLLSKL